MSDFIFVIKGTTIIAEKVVTWNVEAKVGDVSTRVNELNQMIASFAKENEACLFLMKWKNVSEMLRVSTYGDPNCPSAENAISYDYELIPLFL